MGRFSGQSNKVVFTLNNYTVDELIQLELYLDDGESNGQIGYAIVGDEVGEQGTEHLQGEF